MFYIAKTAKLMRIPKDSYFNLSQGAENVISTKEKALFTDFNLVQLLFPVYKISFNQFP
jgi:hypothetical protein